MNKDENKYFIDAAIEASKRSRRVLMLTHVWGVLAIVVLINSCENGWVPRRIERAQAARILYQCPKVPKGFLIIPGATRNIVPPRVSGEQLHSTASIWVDGCLKDLAIMGSFIDRQQLLDGALFALEFGFGSSDIDSRLAALLSFADQNILSVPIPITNLRIDVNDLGLAEGTGFLVLLGWLLVSLRREQHNTERFSNAPRTLAILEANSLFAVARGKDSPRVLGAIVGYASLILPTLTYILLVVNDFRTSGIASFLGSGRVWLTLWLELALAIGVTTACIICVIAYTHLNSLWSAPNVTTALKEKGTDMPANA